MMSYYDWKQARDRGINEALEQVGRTARAAAEARMYTSDDLHLQHLAYLEQAYRYLVIAIGYTPEEVDRYAEWRLQKMSEAARDMKKILDKWDSLDWKPLNPNTSERSDQE